MKERAVQYQGYRDRDIKQRETIQQKHPRSGSSRCQAVEHEEKQDQPEYRICDFDGKLRSIEQEREQRDMTCHREGSEGAQMTPVFERQQAERDDDEQDGLLVHVPAEEKRGIAAKR